jgi:hypothetical protein
MEQPDLALTGSPIAAIDGTWPIDAESGRGRTRARPG